MGFLKTTKIVLLDGVEYEFAALPFNSRTVGMLEELVEMKSGTKLLRILQEAAVMSLTPAYGKDEAVRLVEAGAIPYATEDGPELAKLREIARAMGGVLAELVVPTPAGKVAASAP